MTGSTITPEREEQEALFEYISLPQSHTCVLIGTMISLVACGFRAYYFEK